MFHTRMRQRLSASAPWTCAATAALLAASLWAGPAAAQSAAAAAAAAAAPAPTARVIVKFKEHASLLRKTIQASKPGEDASETRARAFAEDLGSRLRLNLTAGRAVTERSQVVLGEGLTSEQLAQRLSAEVDIEYAVVDQRRKINAAPNDPLYATGPAVSGLSGGPVSGQWYLRAPGGAVRSAINAEAAWNISTGSPNIVVAVLDSGVRFDHVDLKRVSEGGNLLDGYDFITDSFIGNDGNGRDGDPSDPGDAVTAADVSSPANTVGCSEADIADSSWHGTLVSGLIGAMSNNGVGMASVGRTVRVLPVRVLGRCGGFDSDIIAGMRWAAGLNVPGVADNPNRARVLNLSLGGGGVCTAYTDAVRDINNAGAVVVASAGNSAGQAVSVPAKCAGVIGVAGLRHIGTKVGFSDLGPEISLSAPGGNCVNTGANEPCLYPILSTSNSGTTAPVTGAPGSIYTDAFNATVGTSFSAPLVSGTAALMLSVRPALTPDEVRTHLRASAQPFPTTGSTAGVLQCNATTSSHGEECYCNTSTCGAGMLDAGAAVNAAAGAQQPPPTSSGGGGGGATTSLYWLLGIALAAWTLSRTRRS
jgi:serine protease